MQAKEELLEHLGESYGYVNRLVEKKLESVKLNLAETSAKTISGFVSGVVLAVLGLITLLFLLITLGFALSLAFDSHVFGFGAVAVILLVVFLLVLALKGVLITNPVVSRVITKFFEHDGKEV